MNKRIKRIVSVILLLALCVGNISISDSSSEAATKKALNITNMTMSKGQSKQLKLSGAKKVTWKSSKKSVATVSRKGKVTAKKKGSAVITAKANGKSYKCNVTINQPTKKNNDILIVYFSQTGTTKSVANKIQQLTGGDLLRIREKNKYPNDYDKTVARAKRELNKKLYPAISTKAFNMKSYDTVYVGYPVWWHSTPRVINTFLEQYNLKGKTVIPFCTSGGSDISETLSALKKSCNGANILEGYTADEGTKKEIRSWLKEIGQLESTTAETPKPLPTATVSATAVPTPTVTVSATAVPTPTVTVSATAAPTPTATTSATAEPTLGDQIKPDEEKNAKILITYYSATGSTKKVAETIAAHTGGDIFEITPKEIYTNEDLNWTNSTSRVCVEHDNPDSRHVELVTTEVEKFSEYDTIFIGYPIWWGIAAWPVDDFVKENDFTGKTVIPFCTSASSGIGESGNLLAEMAGTGEWQEGTRFNSSVSSDTVMGWIDSLDLPSVSDVQ